MNKLIKQPLISVGIITYNRPKLLKRVIDRLLIQTYRNLEIIISDDQSPEYETRKIVEDFMVYDSRIKYFYQPRNLGLALNANFVLKQATGKFFLWSADDDYIVNEDYIEKLFLRMVQEDCLLVFSDIDTVDENDVIIEKKLNNIYKECNTDNDYLLTSSFKGVGFEIYGLFNLEKLKRYHLDKFWDSQRYSVFAEGIMLSKVFLHGGVRYVGDVKVNYIKGRDNNSGARVSRYVLFVSLIRYYNRLFILYLSSSAEARIKIRISGNLFRRFFRSIIMDTFTSIYKFLYRKINLIDKPLAHK